MVDGELGSIWPQLLYAKRTLGPVRPAMMDEGDGYTFPATEIVQGFFFVFVVCVYVCGSCGVIEESSPLYGGGSSRR